MGGKGEGRSKMGEEGGWEAANAARARESEYLTRKRVK